MTRSPRAHTNHLILRHLTTTHQTRLTNRPLHNAITRTTSLVILETTHRRHLDILGQREIDDALNHLRQLDRINLPRLKRCNTQTRILGTHIRIILDR